MALGSTYEGSILFESLGCGADHMRAAGGLHIRVAGIASCLSEGLHMRVVYCLSH